MKRIKKHNKIVALVFDGSYQDGTHPLTDAALPLQVLALKHPKGKIFRPHTHKPKSRKTRKLAEALMVFSGKVQVDIYHDRERIETLQLTAGQGIMMIDGGMGIKVLKDAEMMEFKNGPFQDDKVPI